MSFHQRGAERLGKAAIGLSFGDKCLKHGATALGQSAHGRAHEVLQIALNNYKATLDELKNKPAVKNAFCSASGEYIGTARVFRVVAAECRKGDIAELDKALKGLDDLVDNTCK